MTGQRTIPLSLSNNSLDGDRDAQIPSRKGQDGYPILMVKQNSTSDEDDHLESCKPPVTI